MADVLASALSYAHRGWSVLPCGQDKRPLLSWSRWQSERADDAQIADWWRRWPQANVAVITGAISGIAVLDLDAKEGGANGSETLQRAGLFVPVTRTVRTPSGGLHAYFRHPGGFLRNWQKRADLPGVDARGDGGYVLAPPSRTDVGVYAAVPETRGVEFADPPSWLVAGMRGERPSAAASPSGEWAQLWSTMATPGDRHPTLVRLIGHLAAHGIGEDEVLAVATLWAAQQCSPALEADEVARTVTGMYRTDTRHHPERRGQAERRGAFWWRRGGEAKQA